MDISFVDSPRRHDAVHLLPCFEPASSASPEDRASPDRLCGQEPAWAASHPGLGDFSGEQGRTMLLHHQDEHGLSRCLLTGLGKRPAPEAEHWRFLDTLRQTIATGMQAARDIRAGAVMLSLAGLETLAPLADAALPLLLEEAVFAALAGMYEFGKLKSAPSEKAPAPDLLLHCAGVLPGPGHPLNKAMLRAMAQASGVHLARDLGNAPANHVRPEDLARLAQRLAAEHDYGIEILEAEAIRALGMGAFAAVFQAAPEQARLIILDTKPDATSEPPLALVGKGVTFDTGGISLKPAEGMEAMKSDMAGAAAILGCLQALGESKAAGEPGARRRVLAVLPCTDNMPGPEATRPGDVVRACNGKTIEIINTDAEGRLLLCDALAHAARRNPVAMVDLATLTGAARVALGVKVAALYDTHPLLAAALQRLSLPLGDLLWRMPCWDFYFEELKSDVADMKNVGTREGGSVNAALFLKQFVPAGIPWLHVDMAGPGFSAKATPLCPAGATGFGVRGLYKLVLESEGLGLG